MKHKDYFTSYPLQGSLLLWKSTTTFGYTKGLSCLLQGYVITAYNEIYLVNIFITMREDAEKEFKPIFNTMLAMAEIAGSRVMHRTLTIETLEDKTKVRLHSCNVRVPLRAASKE